MADNLVKVKLGGQTYHVHISEQERQARKDAQNRAATLHKETIRRKRNHEQKKLSHEQKEEQHRQKVLAARRAQLMLQTQRYLRATSRRPAPPQQPRNKIQDSRPFSAINYPSGTVSARDENGEIDSVLKKINRRVDAVQNYKSQKLLQPIQRVQSARNTHHRDIIQNRPATAAIISKISNEDVQNVTNLNQKNMRLATNKFGQDLFDLMQSGDGSTSSRKQWNNNKNETGSGDNDTFRKESAIFPEKLQKIKPVVPEPIPQPPVVVARIQELRNDINVNTRDRHIPSPLENIPDNPQFLPKPPENKQIQQKSSSTISSSPPKYESVFQVNQPESDATRVNESVATASETSSSVSIRDIDDSESNSSSTIIEKKQLNTGPPGILRRTKSAFERNSKNTVFDSIDLAKNRTKSAGVKRQKSVRWKQIEYQDGTVRPFPQDIENLRVEARSGRKLTIQANLTNNSSKPSILSYKKQNVQKNLIQDAQMTGYAQQHIARKQFNRKQKNPSQNRQIKYSKNTSDRNNNSIRPKSANDYLESRRTPTDNEITQLWQTVKHVIDENEKQNTTVVNPTQIRQLPQSYYLPRPPTANNPAFIYSPGFRGGQKQAKTVGLNRPKVQNPSSLSMEEQRLVQSLDRLNSRLNEIEVNVKK